MMLDRGVSFQRQTRPPLSKVGTCILELLASAGSDGQLCPLLARVVDVCVFLSCFVFHRPPNDWILLLNHILNM